MAIVKGLSQINLRRAIALYSNLILFLIKAKFKCNFLLNRVIIEMYYVRVRVNFEFFSKSYDDFGRS